MGTYQPKAADIVREWHVIDAKDLVLGQVATHAAHLLRGKHKPMWVPHMDVGDNVIIVNADKLDISVRKSQDKNYYFHSGYPGGLKSSTLGEMMIKNPTKVLELAITGMLPHTRLGNAMASKLHIYAGEEHPHQAQQPKPFTIKTNKAKANA